MPALESELEPFSKLQAFSLNDMLNIDMVSRVPTGFLSFGSFFGTFFSGDGRQKSRGDRDFRDVRVDGPEKTVPLIQDGLRA